MHLRVRLSRGAMNSQVPPGGPRSDKTAEGTRGPNPVRTEAPIAAFDLRSAAAASLAGEGRGRR